MGFNIPIPLYLNWLVVWVFCSAAGVPLVFGNEGADTVDAIANTGGLTVVGGNDSADGGDLILTGAGADFVFGNGGEGLSIASGHFCHEPHQYLRSPGRLRQRAI